MQCLVIQPLFTSPSDQAICSTSAVVFWCQPLCKQACIDWIPSSSGAASLRKSSLAVPFLLQLGHENIALSSESNWHIIHLLVAHIHSCKSIHSPGIPTMLLHIALLQRMKVEAFHTWMDMTDLAVRCSLSCTFHGQLLHPKQNELFNILRVGHF